MNYDSRTEISAFLRARGLSLKKQFGQNFLLNKGAREKILKILHPLSQDILWEIGPGIGAMTHMLVNRVKRLTVFELDYGFIAVLKELFGEKGNISIIPGDFIKTIGQGLEGTGLADKIVGNLPYSAASAIIAALIEQDCIPERCVFTVQKEMALRMTALPGSKNYSSFSVFCQSFFRVTNHGNLKAASFYPAPEVISTIVELVPNPEAITIKNRKIYLVLIRDLFSSRRKTIRNNLKSRGYLRRQDAEAVLAAFEAAGINLGDRAERFGYRDFIAAANGFC